jgi:mannosyltransferase
MTSPASRAVLGGRAGVSAGEHPDRAAAFDAGPLWMRILPPVAMFAMGLWRISGPSYWRDEAATMTAVQRPFPAILRMMGNVDAVHGVYYMIIWAVVRLGGAGELVTRLPSAVAMACAAAAVGALGRRLVSPRAGLAAGLLLAALPQISLYAQDAREYAAVTALAATGSYLLVRALATAGRQRLNWLIGYAVCLGVMGSLNVFSLLLVGAHAITVAVAAARAWRRDGGRAAGVSLAAGWLAAAAGAFLLASPILALGIAQRGTLSWITTPPLLGTIEGLRKLVGPATMVLALCVAIALGVVLDALARRPLRTSWPPELLALCLPWLLLPPAVLIGVSYASPVYTFRYVIFCAPAAALIGGAGLAALVLPSPRGALAWVPAVVALAVVAALGVPAQLAARGPDGHGTNIRKANAIVARARRPGDAVLYLGIDSNYFPAAYPGGFVKLDNIGQAMTPSQAGNLVGARLPASVIRARLGHIRRLWLVEFGPRPHPRLLHGLGFRLLRKWQPSQIWLLLYARSGQVARFR